MGSESVGPPGRFGAPITRSWRPRPNATHPRPPSPARPIPVMSRRMLARAGTQLLSVRPCI